MMDNSPLKVDVAGSLTFEVLLLLEFQDACWLRTMAGLCVFGSEGEVGDEPG